MIKRNNQVRLLSAVATVICLGNLIPVYLSFSYHGAWEWNTLSLLDMIGLISLKSSLWGHLFQLIAAMAFAAGLAPLVMGFVGSVRPECSFLWVLSVACSAIVVVSVGSLYATIMIAIYSQGHRPEVEPRLGTYMTAGIIAMEIAAGMLSRRRQHPLSCV